MKTPLPSHECKPPIKGALTHRPKVVGGRWHELGAQLTLTQRVKDIPTTPPAYELSPHSSHTAKNRSEMFGIIRMQLSLFTYRIFVICTWIKISTSYITTSNNSDTAMFSSAFAI